MSDRAKRSTGRLLRGAACGLLALCLATPPAAAGSIRLREVAAPWGLDFRHHHGGSGDYYQPETDGSGVVLFDFDHDGDVDLFFIDGGVFPGYEGETPRSRLFRNEGERRFLDVSDRAGLDVAGYGMGGTAGDVDGDGYVDLYVTAFGANQLFRNRGDGSFVDVTAAAGVADPRWSASAALADVDLDGDLDLYVVNYLDYSLASHVRCGDGQGEWGYCHPDLHDGAHDRLYRNLGDGSFRDDTAASGLAGNDGKGLGVVVADFDDDGWPDVYVANDTTPNYFFRNRGEGRFADESLLSGTAYGDQALAEAGMGIGLGDVDGNGRLDLVVTNYALETNALYANQGDGLFSDNRHLLGIAEPSIPALGFGAALADLDQDGDLDLAIANGHVLDHIERIREGLTYRQRNHLLEMVDGRFEACDDCGLDAVRVSRGLATGDLDGDGDLEIVVTNSNDVAEVYENVTAPAGGWLMADLATLPGGAAAIGARVELEADGRRQLREVVTASSYLSQNATTVHFGLAAASSATLRVRWPDGRRARYREVPAGRRLALYRRVAGAAPRAAP